MNKDEVLQRIIDISKVIFNDEQLVLDANSSAKDVKDWDSMTNLFLIDAIEEQFSVKFSLDEIMNARNLGDLCQYILNKKA